MYLQSRRSLRYKRTWWVQILDLKCTSMTEVTHIKRVYSFILRRSIAPAPRHWLCVCPSRWVGGRTDTCGCATTPGLATAPSWSLWMTRSTSEWSPWRRGPSSSWSRPTREPAPASGTRCRAACPWTQGETPLSRRRKSGGETMLFRT